MSHEQVFSKDEEVFRGRKPSKEIEAMIKEFEKRIH
jgi:hypothetical protein